MPGGERAIREPWRMAVAHLRDAGIDAFTVPTSLAGFDMNGALQVGPAIQLADD
jgi:hypothetical protein